MTRTFFHSFDPPTASPISGATVDLEASAWQPGTEPGLLTIARSNPGSVPDS
jgi:hypothetical protein